MPLFFYLPLIVWTGMVEVMADATTHDPDERNGRGDPANPMMDDTAIIISHGGHRLNHGIPYIRLGPERAVFSFLSFCCIRDVRFVPIADTAPALA